MTTLIKPILTPANPAVKRMIDLTRRFAALCRVNGFTAKLQTTLDGYAVVFPKIQTKRVSSRTIATKFQKFRKGKNTKGIAISVQDLPGRKSVALVVRAK